MSLVEALNDKQRRDALVADSISELEADLDERSGVSALALRTAYKAVRKLSPAFVQDNVRKLLPGFAPVLDRHHGEAGGDTAGHFTRRATVIAEELLGVTDQRAAAAQNKAAKSIYEKLRPKAVENIAAGMPRLADLVDRHA